ncbi:hypothetical protein NC651_002359 [Populus alba x Populus x berolinensis]|nr:hypothetical protein NC651_002359 [Populus alba x Populus x berolinensis]
MILFCSVQGILSKLLSQQIVCKTLEKCLKTGVSWQVKVQNQIIDCSHKLIEALEFYASSQFLKLGLHLISL